MEIVTGTIQDIPMIQEIAELVWPLTYGNIHAPGQTAYMLDIIYNTEALTAQMDEGHNFVLTKDGNLVVGFADYQLNVDGNSAMLNKLYMRPEVQGKGYGKRLVEAVREACVEKNQKSLMLRVNRWNKAVEFYKKCGFVIVKEVDEDIGNGYHMNDYLMEMSLK